MTPVEVLFLLVIGVALLAWYLSWTATRLDRLHGRVESSQASLDAQLVRRAGAASDLATSGLLDPASSVLLAEVAEVARRAGPDDREPAESDLSRALRAAFDGDAAQAPDEVAQLRALPRGAVLVDELAESCRRVLLARRFHNDAVRVTRVVRRRRLVRSLRLAGRAALPESFEMDDAPPAALERVRSRPRADRSGAGPRA